MIKTKEIDDFNSVANRIYGEYNGDVSCTIKSIELLLAIWKADKVGVFRDIE